VLAADTEERAQVTSEERERPPHGGARLRSLLGMRLLSATGALHLGECQRCVLCWHAKHLATDVAPQV
jgi:hypothetical protein